ncbi:hypothetical protein SCALM49S_05816 [Streptomyces californicus]
MRSGTRTRSTPTNWRRPSSPSCATPNSPPATSPGSVRSPSPTRTANRPRRANWCSPRARSRRSCAKGNWASSSRSWPTAGARARSPPAGCWPPSPSYAPPTSSSIRTNWSPATATSPNRTTPGCWTPWTSGARTCSTGWTRPRCRRSPPRSSPYGTWTWWTTTPGRRRSRCWRGQPLRDALTQPVRVLMPDGRPGPCARTPRGGCATTPCWRAAARPDCARRAATPGWPGCTTRWTPPASTTPRCCGPSAYGPRSPPSWTSRAARPNCWAASPTGTARSAPYNCTPSTRRWPISIRTG